MIVHTEPILHSKKVLLRRLNPLLGCPLQENILIVPAEPGVQKRDKEGPQQGVGGGGIEKIKLGHLGPISVSSVARLPGCYLRLGVKIH